MKDFLLMAYPDMEVFASVSNEPDTLGDIDDMGQRLAQEVVDFIEQERINVGRIR